MIDLLFHIPENPAPEGIVAGLLAMDDGKRIRYALAPATARPLHGTVVILPGRNECIEKYFETIRDLAARGLATAILDWRGQGGSDRLLRDPARGYVRSFDQYANDLDQFFEEIVLPDCRGPYYVLAHSTGALVALLAARNLVNRVRRMVLSAPLLSFAGLPFSMATAGRLSSILCAIGFGRLYLGGGLRPDEFPPFSTNVLTSDMKRYARNAALCKAAPHLVLGGATAAWVSAACEAIATVHEPELVARIHVPVLVVAAGADEVVSTAAIEHYARRLRSGSLLTIDGARHEILQEADFYREQFLAAFDAFVPDAEA
jgi:lysophospholipase